MIRLETSIPEHWTCTQESIEQNHQLPDSTHRAQRSSWAVHHQDSARASFVLSVPGFKERGGKYCHSFPHCFTPTALEGYMETQF